MSLLPNETRHWTQRQRNMVRYTCKKRWGINKKGLFLKVLAKQCYCEFFVAVNLLHWGEGAWWWGDQLLRAVQLLTYHKHLYVGALVPPRSSEKRKAGKKGQLRKVNGKKKIAMNVCDLYRYAHTGKIPRIYF